MYILLHYERNGEMKKYRLKFNYITKIIMIVLSAFIQSYIIQAFITPEHFISGGFTGLSLLLNMIFKRFDINISLSFLLFALNFPVALICMKHISKKFVTLSLIQITLTSLFLKIFTFEQLFHNTLLNIIIGGVVFGLQLTLALKAGGSSGGTDFIALYISNKINKSIWEYIFIFNILLIGIFGYLFGFDNAGYSILFQFVTTKTISTFYNRYHRITMNIITTMPDVIIDKYIKTYNHGITKVYAEGGYTKQPKYILYAVVSVYEVDDIARMALKIDNNAIINTFKTQDFYGSFYIPEL